MVTRSHDWLVVSLLVAVTVAGGALWLGVYRPRQRVREWVSHAPPIVWNLVDRSKLRYQSYDEWKRAAQEIPDIDRTLIRMYRDAEDERARRDLIYAMGASAGDSSIALLCDIFLNSPDEDLKVAVFGLGLYPNADLPRAQIILRDLITDSEWKAGERIDALIALLIENDEFAIRYAREHGPALLQLAESDGSPVDVLGKLIEDELSRLSKDPQELPAEGIHLTDDQLNNSTGATVGNP